MFESFPRLGFFKSNMICIGMYKYFSCSKDDNFFVKTANTSACAVATVSSKLCGRQQFSASQHSTCVLLLLAVPFYPDETVKKTKTNDKVKHLSKPRGSCCHGSSLSYVGRQQISSAILFTNALPRAPKVSLI